MSVLSNRIWTLVSSAILFLAAAYYAWSGNMYVLIVPSVILAVILFIQYPLYLFYSLMIAIPWSMEYNFTASLGTDLPDEPLMLIASFAALIYMTWRRAELSYKKIHPLLWLILLQFAWMILTVIASTDVLLSFKYALAKTWYLLAFVALPLILFRDEKIFKRSMLLLLVSMLLVMTLALVRHAWYNWSFEEVNTALAPFYRNHVTYSALLVFMVPVQIAVIRLCKTRSTKFFLIAVLVLMFAALYFSYSRGAWLALIAGLFSYWLLKKRLMFTGFLFLVVAVTGAFIFFKNNNRFLQLSSDYKSTIFHTDFREHLIATYRLKDMSNAERMNRWVAGVRMIGDNWKTGIGPSTFYPAYQEYTLPAFRTYVSKNPEHSTVHNYFLLMIIEQGMMGLLLFISLLTALFWYAQKIYNRANGFWKITIAAVTAILVMECVVNFLSDMIETDKAGSVFYLCIAVMIIADRKTKSNSAANI